MAENDVLDALLNSALSCGFCEDTLPPEATIAFCSDDCHDLYYEEERAAAAAAIELDSFNYGMEVPF